MASVGIISMGKMGSTIAHSLIDSGHEVFYASDSRSKKTKQTAIELNAKDVVFPEKLFEICDYVFCIIKDGDWRTYTEMAIDAEFTGVYVDFNGLDENDAEWITKRFTDSSIRYVDGAMRAWPISEQKEVPEAGNPAFGNFEPRTMYLSGKDAQNVINLFKGNFWKFRECQPPAKYVVLDIASMQQSGMEYPFNI